MNQVCFLKVLQMEFNLGGDSPLLSTLMDNTVYVIVLPGQVLENCVGYKVITACNLILFNHVVIFGM